MKLVQLVYDLHVQGVTDCTSFIWILYQLSEEEACRVFQVCVRTVKAIKEALGAEKVYLNTMCDGGINHLHLQLFPRYAADPIGSKRFVAERQPLADGQEIASRIRAALQFSEDSHPPA